MLRVFAVVVLLLNVEAILIIGEETESALTVPEEDNSRNIQIEDEIPFYSEYVQIPEGEIIPEGRTKRGKQLLKGKLWFLLKTILGLKLLLFAISLPLSAITAKILSVNAFGFSIAAFVTSAVILLRSLLSGSGRRGPQVIPPPSPIIIQSSSEPVRSLSGGPKILIQPEIQLPDVEEMAKINRWRGR